MTRQAYAPVRSMVQVGCVVLLGWPCAAAQSAAPNAPDASVRTAESKTADPLKRQTPQSAVYAFLEACHAKNYNLAARYLDLRSLPIDRSLSLGPDLAQQLERILDRDPEFDLASLSQNPEGDRTDGLPENEERVASFRLDRQDVNLRLERVTFRSGMSVWLFSKDSIDLIPRIARLASDSPIEKYLPVPLVSWKLLDTPLWRWIALILLALGLNIIFRLFSRLVLLVLNSLAHRLLPRMDRTQLALLGGPLQLLLSVVAFRALLNGLEVSALLRVYLGRILALLFFGGLSWLGAAIVDLGMRHLRSRLESRNHTLLYSSLPLTARVLKVTILGLVVVAILNDWGYNTNALLAGVGIGGIAIALAAQKTIENLFGGVAVISDRPVYVGDFCKFGDQSGTVEDIGLRSTRLRTPGRTLVTVPNAQFSSMTLENFSQRDKMLFHLRLNIRRDTTPDQVRTLLKSITAILQGNPKLEAGGLPVRFVGVGSYSLDLEVSAYVLTRDDTSFLQIQQELLLAILDAVEGAGTALALPTQASISYPARTPPAPEERSAAEELTRAKQLLPG